MMGNTIEKREIYKQELSPNVEVVVEEIVMYLAENKSDVTKNRNYTIPYSVMDTDSSIDHKKVP